MKTSYSKINANCKISNTKLAMDFKAF